MSVLFYSALLSACISGAIAEYKQRSTYIWAGLGLIAGPIAVMLILYVPSRRPGKAPVAPESASMRSIADEIYSLEEMRQRGIISDDEFTQGKAQLLAWPLSSPIPPALSPQRVWADGRRTWASYQPATRAAFTDLARRHELKVRWRDDVPFEVVCTYPVQPRLSLEFTLALEKGTIHCWGEGWELEGVDIGRPDKGMPGDLDQALDALIEGSGRVLIRTAYGATAPFWVALQVFRDDRWRTIRRRVGLPWPPVWRRQLLANHHGKPGTAPR
ncbi:hypothetical protein SAMN05192583_3345 [Sphingomonas gellani]|uniref:Short C-terminal domain-containing protein n=1 Tax=Sphingomonas gellani TaxID=1166340 RepID=A0A1H8IPZ8_9SPHN|nr:SHOCT domain-containing protein [Sphingomonas gellani]SEN69748.1 hypothetical protein SAMN05192583_3345 [Sphingomonas gellani]